MAVKPGDILGNRYRLDALIGQGGMGHVFAATDLNGPAPPVAIKVVSRLLFDETLYARLHREAEAAARIRSDYVPRVLEVSDTENREMYLVMERLVGESLSQRMRDRGPLPWSEAMVIAEDVLRGLIDAHTAGVVHRDIKPSNVFLAQKGGARTRAMVLDFGVCKTDQVDHEHLTGTGEAIGTVAYMAPEQIRGASKVDDRADLYAFGVVVFEMICGRLPHDGPSQMAILASKLENPPARLRDCARVAVPDGLDELVGKALARDPATRFASAQELLRAWRKLGNLDAATSVPPPSRQPSDAGAPPADPHDAPTTLSLSEHEATAHGNASAIPIEAHPTQTALTAGTGLTIPKNNSGRLAFVLAACALLAGVVVVVAAFTRSPADAKTDSNAASGAAAAASGESSPIASVAASSAAGSIPAPEASADVVETSEPVSPAAPVKTDSKKPVTQGRPGRPSTRPGAAGSPKSSGPHITSQPRY